MSLIVSVLKRLFSTNPLMNWLARNWYVNIKTALVAALLISLISSSARAETNISSVSLRGLQIGAPTTITINGSDLLPNPQIILPLTISKQVVQDGATANRVTLEITLDPSASPGIYPLRVASGKGVSKPVSVGIDRLPQTLFIEKTASLPAAMTGNLTGNQILQTVITGKKDQRLVADLESARLGSKLKPTLRILDSRGAQLAWSAPQYRIGGDARFEIILPSDGEYTIELHDMLYRGAAPGHFRLKLGSLHYADLVHPIGVQKGGKVSLQFFSSSLPPLTKLDFTAPSDTGAFEVPSAVPATAELTGSRPHVILSDHVETIETAQAGGKLQTLLQAPTAINGRISKPGEEDKYLLTVAPGSKLRFDVLARRIGSSLDGVLVIQNEKGNQLARNDDRPNTSDPGLDFTVPAKVTKVVISLRDLLKKGGDDFIYRISIRDLSKPDFTLNISTDRLNIPAGATQIVKVQAVRSNYNGAIRLVLAGLPKDVKVTGAEIPAGDTIALVSLTAPTGAKLHKVVSVIGSSVDSKTAILRTALLAITPESKLQPWLRSELALAIAEPSLISIAWKAPNDSVRGMTGSDLPVEFKLSRNESAKGLIRVSLLTTQVAPKKTIKQNKVVNDVDRMLRLAAGSEFGPEVADASVQMLIPADLAPKKWGLVLKAELLSADKKNVLASALTPVQYLDFVRPLTIQLTGSNQIEAKAGGNQTGQFTGKIVRLKGFQHPVTITLAGLPKGYAVPRVVLPADQTDFALAVGFPSGAKPAELKNIKLIAVARPNPKKPQETVRANPVSVTLKISPGK